MTTMNEMEDMFDCMSFHRVSVVSVSVSFQGLEDSFLSWNVVGRIDTNIIMS